MNPDDYTGKAKLFAEALNHENDLKAENAALRSQIEEARGTNRELNRRNGELQRSLNLEAGRKAWYGYWHAAFELFGSAMRQKEAAERDLATAQRERSEIMASLGINYDIELVSEDSGYEVPAEPEPQYFETLVEAVQFIVKLTNQADDQLATAQARIARYEADLRIIADCSTRPRCKSCSDRAAEALAEPQSGEK